MTDNDTCNNCKSTNWNCLSPCDDNGIKRLGNDRENATQWLCQDCVKGEFVPSVSEYGKGPFNVSWHKWIYQQ